MSQSSSTPKAKLLETTYNDLIFAPTTSREFRTFIAVRDLAEILEVPVVTPDLPPEGHPPFHWYRAGELRSRTIGEMWLDIVKKMEET